MKRLKIFTLLSFFLLFLSYFLGNYLFNYPLDFNWKKTIFDTHWLPFLFIILGIIVVSISFAFIPFPGKKYVHRFFLVLAILSLITFSLFSFVGIREFLRLKNKYGLLVAERVKDAERDIKTDNIVYETFGLPIMSKDVIEIDSLYATYGIKFANQGCTLDFARMKANEEYEKQVESYLEKRNGIGWKQKLEAQVDAIKVKYSK